MISNLNNVIKSKKYLFVTITFFIFFLIVFFRVRSFFRQPLDVFPPYSIKIFIFLILVDIFFIVMFFFSIKKPKLNDSNINIYVGKIVDFVILPFAETHLFLSQKFRLYGEFFNKFNLVFQAYNIINYSYIIILCFVCIPFTLILLTLIFETLFLYKIFFTFKLIPLLLLPLILKLILSITINFLDIQLKELNDEIVFLNINEIKDITDKSVSKIINKKFIFDLKKLNEKIFQVSRIHSKNSNLLHLSTREILFYIYLFSHYKKNIIDLNNLFDFYNKCFSFIRYILLIFLITYFLILDILLYLYHITL